MSEGKPFIRCGELFDHPRAFEHNPLSEELFVEAMNEALNWHVTNCRDYKSFLAENGLADFKKAILPEQIPPLSLSIFTNFYLTSVPEKLAKIKYNFSGRNKEEIFLDARSCKRILKITENIFSSLGLVEPKQKNNYLCFTKDPLLETEKNTYSSFFNRQLIDLTAHRSVYYGIKLNKKINEFNFNVETVSKKILDFSSHPASLRIIGDAGYFLYCCDWLEERNINLKLNKNSCVLLFADFEKYKKLFLSENKLKSRISKLLSISEENIRYIFRIAEQPIPYLSCEKGRFHLPIYAKATILEPENLLPVKAGEEGLLTLMSPFISSYPAISVLTPYKAVIEYNCPCGRLGKTFKILDYLGVP